MEQKVLVFVVLIGVISQALTQGVGDVQDPVNPRKGVTGPQQSSPNYLSKFAVNLLDSLKSGNSSAILSLLSSPIGQGVIKTLPPDIQQTLTSGNIPAIVKLLSSNDAQQSLKNMIGGQQSASSGANLGQLMSMLGNLFGNNTNLPGLLQSVMGGDTTGIASLLSSPTVQGLLGTLPSNIRTAITSGNLTAITSMLSSPEAQAYLKSALSGISGGNQTSSLANIMDALKGLPFSNPGANPISGILSGMTGGNSAILTAMLGPRLATFGVSQTCQEDLGKLAAGIQSKEMWAMKMVDAMGKIPDGVLYSFSYVKKFVGDYDECKSIMATGLKNNKKVELFKTKFCQTQLYILEDSLIPGLKGSITTGTCVSERCDNNDVDGILKAAQQILLNETMLVWPISNCFEDMSMGAGEVAVICVLVIFGFLMLVGTLYDIFAVQLDVMSYANKAKSYELELNGIDNQAFNNSNGNIPMEKGLDTVTAAIDTAQNTDGSLRPANGHIQGATVAMNKTNETPKRIFTLPEQVILAFSVYTNGVKILGTNQGSGTLGAINGIRFLSMAWVILGHTYFFANGYDENLASHMLAKMQQWTFMFVPYATVSVDSFFAISGVLVGYLTLKELKKVNGPKKFNWGMFYFHRFWRLTPPYMLLLMVMTVLVPFFNDGPMWTQGDNPLMTECRDTWWTNLLYINNYAKTDKMCMGWSWYLANDMQFYIISPLILLPLFFNIFAGAGVSLVLMLASWIATGVIVHIHKYPAQSFVAGTPQAEDGDYMKNVYFPSYARIGPYLVGLFTGYLLYRQNCKCKIPKIVNLIAWIVCIGVCCIVIYTPFSKDGSHVMGVSESAAYMTLSRTVWGVAVCWIVFACACGYGGWINELLSWKAFIPLGRLTYCAYLVHPVCMSVFTSSLRRPYYFTDYSTAYLFFGHMVTAYGVSFVASLAFESPMMALEKAIFKRGKK